MNKKILLTMTFALVCLLSAAAIHASDVNMTDSAQKISDDASLPISDVSQDSVSESIDSNNLSTDDMDAPIKDNSKNQTEITPSGSSVYYEGEFDVTLKDSDANIVLKDKTINFLINNVKYTAVTDKNGVAGVKLLLTPGKYTVKAYFAGDDNYNASNNLTLKIEILPTIKADNIVKYYKGTTKYTATFYDSEGKVLANRYVKITVNGKTYTKKTNSKGVVSMAINLKPGTYKVVATDPLTGYTKTTTFKILSTISGSNLKKVKGDSKKFAAKFLKSNGKPLANKYIKFKFRGQTYKVRPTQMVLQDFPSYTQARVHTILSATTMMDSIKPLRFRYTIGCQPN